MKTDYFSIMEKQVECSLKAGELLKTILDGYTLEKLTASRAEMHAIEHSADTVRHEALLKLARDFITPIERDDLLALVQILDDVTDAIDEVAIDLYMYCIDSLPLAVGGLVDVMLDCVRSLKSAVAEFRNFKKTDKLMPLLIAVNTAEGKADSVYIEAMHELFAKPFDPKRAVGIKEIYNSLELCCDLCEHAADVIENAVMNNT